MSNMLLVNQVLTDFRTPKQQLVKARKTLKEDPEKTFREIIVSIKKDQLTPYAEVCKAYVHAMIQDGGGPSLLKYCHQAVNSGCSIELALGYIMILLQWMSYWSDVSSQILKEAKQAPEVKSQLCTLLHILLSYDCEVKVVGRQNLREVLIVEKDKGLVKYLWQVEACRQEFARQLVVEVEAKTKPQIEIKERHKAQAPISDLTIIALWEMIVDHAALALREEGDYIAFKDPDLTMMDLKGFLVKPKIWPNVEVVLMMNIFGTEIKVPVTIDHGIILECDVWSQSYRSYLNLALLAGIRHIVGDDRMPNNGYKTAHNVNGNFHCNGEKKRQPPRAHCQRLRVGTKASAKAAASCQQVFGRPLAPGKTFHRQGEGEVIVRQSTEVTASCIEKLVQALVLQ